MSVPAEQRETGFIFQDYALFPHLTVAQNLAFALRPLRLSGEQQRQRIQEMLSLVALTPLAQRYPHELSGGQQQRVAIARALVCRPQLLLLDEPFSNIDAQVRWSLIRELRALLKSLNMAAVFVTHSKEEAFAFADRLALLENGRVAQIGTPKQLYHQPASPYVAEFLGRGNLVRCDWLAAGHLASALGEIRVECDPAACPDPLLFVRPQLLAVTPGGQGAVLEQQFLGSHVRCLIDWQGEHYEAWHHEWLTEPECGVSLSLRPHAPVLFSRTEWPQLHSRL
jgi:iron(III) transport system ATP-binding protein